MGIFNNEPEEKPCQISETLTICKTLPNRRPVSKPQIDRALSISGAHLGFSED